MSRHLRVQEQFAVHHFARAAMHPRRMRQHFALDVALGCR